MKISRFLFCSLLVSMPISAVYAEVEVTNQVITRVNRFMSQKLRADNLKAWGEEISRGSLRSLAKDRCINLMKSWGKWPVPKAVLISAESSHLPLDLIVLTQQTPHGSFFYAFTVDGIRITHWILSREEEFSR